MQHRDFLAKLAQIRQVQTRAMQHFAETQERLARLEGRLHASSSSQDQNRDVSNSDVAFLPESGDLELLGSFTPASQADVEDTERIALPRATDSEGIASSPLMDSVEEQL